MTHLEVTAINRGTWSLLRNARLAALDDSPESFGADLEEEASWGEERWASQLEEGHWGVIVHEGLPVGLLGIRPATDVADCDCWISSVWVAAAHRGGPALGLLMDWADAVSREADWGCQGLGVWVENLGAQRAFTRCGFVQDGGQRSSTHFPGRHYVRMLRSVARP